jgi:hypothetical protein
MKNDDPGQILHDRATRGLPLTEDEQTQLGDWYAALDRDEVFAVPAGREDETLLSLRAEVRSGVQQLLAAAQRIQELNDQNDTLRRDIAVLQQRLAHRPVARSV